MGLMYLNLATLNARELRDPSKCVRLLGELSNLCVSVAAVQETHFTCAEDCRVLRDDFTSFQHSAAAAALGSLLVGRSLNAFVNLVFVGDGVGGGRWFWPMLPLKASSFGWSWFMYPLALARDTPFSDGWSHSLMIGNG